MSGSIRAGRRQLVLGAAALACTPWLARAASFAMRPIRIVVPFTTGGGTDVVGRPLLQALGTELGQSVFIDNKPGAGTVIGTDAVAKAAPDGHTLLLTTSSVAINASLVKRLPYDTERDLAGVGRVCQGPLVIACRADAPFRNLADLIRAAKARPGKLTYASSGNGSSVHLGAELFKMMTGTHITHIPYRGAGPAYTDLLGGQVDLTFATAGGVHKFVESGRMRALAVTSKERVAAYPGVPTAAETVPGYAAEVWYAMFAPGATPPAVLDQLNAALRRAADAPTYRDALEREGLRVLVNSPQEMSALLRSEAEHWRKVVAQAHVTID